MLTFKAATEADAIRLLYWRNNEEAMLASVNQQPVALASHLSWLHDTLRRQDVFLWIARDQSRDRFAGSCRVDIEDGQAMLSLVIDPEQRGHGYASLMIEKMVNTAHDAGATTARALVRDTNYASLRAFWSAGFRPVEWRQTGEDRMVMLQLPLQEAKEPTNGDSDSGGTTPGTSTDGPAPTRGARRRPRHAQRRGPVPEDEA